MNPDAVRCIAAIAAITVIEIMALCKGKNGLMLRLSIAAIALLAGISLGELIR
jgi:hypothetical protein